MQSLRSFRQAAVQRSWTAQARLPTSRALTVRAQALAVGDQLPPFELETDGSTPDQKITLKSEDIVRDKGAVIFFYPKANTSGCTTQACGFNDNLSTFESAGYGVFGISPDPPTDQVAWKAQHGFKYPLLSDPSQQTLAKLGVQKEGGGVNRSHLVVEKGGKIKATEYGVASKESVPKALSVIANATKLDT